MHRKHTNTLLQICLTVLILAGLVLPAPRPVQAAAVLTITPLTWNVIGLDSNNVNVGPNSFPLGVKVCNTGDTAATGVTTSLAWLSSNSYIGLRPGSLGTDGSPQPSLTLAAGACAEFYYDILVQRNPAAYNTTRRYQVTATANGGLTASTPAPRELFVEKLISQSRNAITDIEWKLAGAATYASSKTQPMNLVVGSTYDIKLVASTATQGYNQLESYINLTNTIFRINSVSTTYTASSSGQFTTPLLYADACGWDNNPLSPTYRSCVVSDNKSGGSITNTFNVTILSGGGTSVTLNSLVYDFSGSSYHYNADYSSTARIATILHPVTFRKAFTPASVAPGAISTLSFTLTNAATTTVAGVSFTDPLPAGLVVANPPAASTTCSAATFAPAAGATSLSFTGIVPVGSCTAQVNVTAAAANTYRNTTGALVIGANNTGQTASANLIVASPNTNASCGSGVTMAQWTVPTGATNPPDTGGSYSTTGSPTTRHTNVSTATLSAARPSDAGVVGGAWNTWGYGGNGQYVEFVIDTRNFSDVSLSFDYARSTGNPEGPTSVTFSYSLNGTNFTTFPGSISPSATSQNVVLNFSGLTNTTGNTYFRLTGSGASHNNQNAYLSIDNMTFRGTGCSLPPAIAKSFTPAAVAVNGTSTLRLTLTNPNSSSLSGLAFTDPLPAGMTATVGTQTACGGTLTRTANNLSFSGGTLAANASCNIDVTVTGVTPGVHTNVTGFISSTQSGTVTGPGGSAAADLTVYAAPGFSKAFAPKTVTVGSQAVLTFTLTNPNAAPLSGVAFTDPLPPGMTVASPPDASNSCGAVFTPTAGANSLSFSGGTIPANGFCTVQVKVTAPATPGSYTNTSSGLSTPVTGLGAPAASDTLTVIDHTPGLVLTKQVAASSSGPWSSFLRTAPVDTVYYRLTVENIGDVALNSVYVSDPTLSLTGCDLRTPGTLNVGEVKECKVSAVADAGSVMNTASAAGSYNNTYYTSSDTAEYLAAAQVNTPHITLFKQVAASSVGPWAASLTNINVGDPLYYEFTILNSGNVPVSGLSIQDLMIDGEQNCEFISPLAAGSATVCVVGPVTAAVGTVTNTATAAASSHSLTSAPASATYTSGAYSISGVTWQDDNTNTLKDGLEQGLFNTLLALYKDTNANGVFDSAVDQFLGNQYSGADGSYTFSNLPPGTYLVVAPATIDTRSLVVGMSSTLVVQIVDASIGGRNFGYYPPNPNAVTIYDFMAGPAEGGVTLLWSTASEINNLGFYLYRRPAAGGDFVPLNAEIIASRSPGQLEGAQYEWLDESADPQVEYVYRLEALDVDGSRQTFEALYQPVVQPVDRPFKVMLPIIRN